MFLFPKLINNSDLFNRSDIGNWGFKNMGNTCYVNSTIQSIMHIYPLIEYLIDSKNLVGKKKTPKPIDQQS